jgi:cullin 1
VYDEYISKVVIPSLGESHDEFFLRTLVTRWKNHKLLTKWLAKIFNYLDRYYIVRYNLPKLQNVGIESFRNTIYKELHVKTRLAVLKEMEKDREGEIVDTDLLRDTLSIFQEVGMGTMDAYRNDFEVYMLECTGEYYHKCASAWIQEDSTPDYLRKAEARLLEEEARVDKYLHVEGKSNLLKEADGKLLEQYQVLLLEKQVGVVIGVFLVTTVQGAYFAGCPAGRSLSPASRGMPGVSFAFGFVHLTYYHSFIY